MSEQVEEENVQVVVGSEQVEEETELVEAESVEVCVVVWVLPYEDLPQVMVVVLLWVLVVLED